MENKNRAKTRLDAACVKRGLFESREKAQAAVMAGLVKVNGMPADKAGRPVKETDAIELTGPGCPYVSRGGLKLKGAIDALRIKIKGEICMDVGAATGGFSDCLLQEGADKVYAVDVGEGQLHEKIKKNPRLVFMPRTNARFLRPELFPEQIEFCAVDVSFISLKLVLGPVSNCLAPGGGAVALIKPQFELGPKDLKKGIVKSEELRLKVVEDLRKFLKENIKGFEEKGLMDSPVKGAKGNTEFLWLLKKI